MDTQRAYEAIRAYWTTGTPEFGYDSTRNLCVYRAEEDSAKRCAIGCILPDALYSPEMEQQGVTDLLKNFPVLQGFFWEADVDFLASAQGLHDRIANDMRRDAPGLAPYSPIYDILRAEFVRTLDQLAATFDLTVPQG